MLYHKWSKLFLFHRFVFNPFLACYWLSFSHFCLIHFNIFYIWTHHPNLCHWHKLISRLILSFYWKFLFCFYLCFYEKEDILLTVQGLVFQSWSTQCFLALPRTLSFKSVGQYLLQDAVAINSNHMLQPLPFIMVNGFLQRKDFQFLLYIIIVESINWVQPFTDLGTCSLLTSLYVRIQVFTHATEQNAATL